VVLLLDGLEVVDEYTEHVVDYGLAGRATPAHLPKIRPPDGHLPTAMRRESGPSIDHSGELIDGETSAMPLRNPCEIGWGRLERRGSGTITTAVHAVACATIPHKHG
jgi:hypothetical protein